MEHIAPFATPGPGERLQRFVGDRVRFTIRDQAGVAGAGWKGLLRTNLGRAAALRHEIIAAHTRSVPRAGNSWRDLTMRSEDGVWALELPLAEVGFFKAKPYLLDPRGWQHWPNGPDIGIAVHPDSARTANTIYCAFTRLFGPGKSAHTAPRPGKDRAVQSLDRDGYTVIPPSAKLRDLKAALPHIVDTLGFRILHLLPVHPTPTTYARFGRFGSPYAALDLTAIDPALVEFDRRSTGVDQFRELTYAAHLRGARVLLDIVINHTGWGSVLQENCPQWFLRDPNGAFVSPGAWGTTWEDLVELTHQDVGLWDKLAETFLEWCRRGVDGFRCDAGYKVPVSAWQYIIARVQTEYPDTLFLLEGLGGAWDTTEALLTEGGMQWAYSELFQNYGGPDVAGYLDHSFRQGGRTGLLIHYSETHDNERLAAKGRGWSLLRNRLCALASVSGGFGITTGVEWLATERINVHESTGLAWGDPQNIVPELSLLNGLLLDHPCFFDGARISRLSTPDSLVLALHRISAEGKDELLVLVNMDPQHPHALRLSALPAHFPQAPGAHAPPASSLATWVDLLGQQPPEFKVEGDGDGFRITMSAGAAFCLAPNLKPVGLAGNDYRLAKTRAAFAIQALGRILPLERTGELNWRFLAEQIAQSPESVLAAFSQVADLCNLQRADEDFTEPERSARETFVLDQPALVKALAEARERRHYFQLVKWSLLDARRTVPVPPKHWLLVEDVAPFRAALSTNGGRTVQNVCSIPAGLGHIACFPPGEHGVFEQGRLLLERYAAENQRVHATLEFLPSSPPSPEPCKSPTELRPDDVLLLTNRRGAMSRIRIDLGRVASKYDCVLGANLHPSLPVDRHVFVKRMRVWISADGFLSPLDFRNLQSFCPTPPATWEFLANAGDGRTVEVCLIAEMLPGRNTVVFRFNRPSAAKASGKQLPASADVRLTARFDIEDRNFHCETRRNGGAEHHFNSHIHSLSPDHFEAIPGGRPVAGFQFAPAKDRHLFIFTHSGEYHPQAEWSENLPHSVEQSRGQVPSGDAFSPGWFELPLPKGAETVLIVTAEPDQTAILEEQTGTVLLPGPVSLSGGSQHPGEAAFEEQLARATRAFIVKRDHGFTVIAGYPWFLDWGRDTFICARGLLAAGLIEEVKGIVATFAAFEDRGTLPNTIFGEDASNRDTSDAPLWFGVVCDELASQTGSGIYEMRVGPKHRALAQVLSSIASHYVSGTPNGIRMDPDSALVWSPSHFTWMDTNYPACTPRQGYPIEIQVLWIRLLRQLAFLDGSASPGGRDQPEATDWTSLADKAQRSFEQWFWLNEPGYYADLLVAAAGQPAATAVADDALRSNCLFAVSLGLAQEERARRCVAAAQRYLVVPGALRSLAPLPLKLPLPIIGNHGHLLNQPTHPYWGRYEGDEDTHRKPSYHNGTAWTWTYPIFCEALARAWDFAPEAVATAKAYLCGIQSLLDTGCLGHLPEVLDGDAPHQQRGCDAQSWSVTEALRVWKLLTKSSEALKARLIAPARSTPVS